MSATLVYGVIVSDTEAQRKLYELRDADKLPEALDFERDVLYATESSWSSGNGEPVAIEPSVLCSRQAWIDAIQAVLPRVGVRNARPLWTLFDM